MPGNASPRQPLNPSHFGIHGAAVESAYQIAASFVNQQYMGVAITTQAYSCVCFRHISRRQQSYHSVIRAGFPHEVRCVAAHQRRGGSGAAGAVQRLQAVEKTPQGKGCSSGVVHVLPTAQQSQQRRLAHARASGSAVDVLASSGVGVSVPVHAAPLVPTCINCCSTLTLPLKTVALHTGLSEAAVPFLPAAVCILSNVRKQHMPKHACRARISTCASVLGTLGLHILFRNHQLQNHAIFL